MKAVGFTLSRPITHADSLVEFELPKPDPGEHDLLVKICAVSVNPADAKVRTRSAKTAPLETPRILGFDAVGIVEAMGPQVTGFQIGDRVYYAGDVTRGGSNAEYQTVDARIAANAPTTLSDAEAAVVPLVGLTAWEAIFDRLRIDPTAEGKTLLIIGGAGGVGSMATQIAKQVTKLEVRATVSRPESAVFATKMGADHVADHRDLVQSVKALGHDTVDYIFNTADTVSHWDAMAELIAPQGTISSIVEFEGGVELSKLQSKSAGFVWELMFTRPMYKTRDLKRQHDILRELASLIDAGRIRSTLQETIAGLSAESIKRAHAAIETRQTIGKIAIAF